MSNMTIQYHIQPVEIFINSPSVFVVLSVAITMPRHSDLTVLLTDSSANRHFHLPLHDLQSLCTVTDNRNNIQKVFICPNKTPARSQSLVEWGIKKNPDMNVSMVLCLKRLAELHLDLTSEEVKSWITDQRRHRLSCDFYIFNPMN